MTGAPPRLRALVVEDEALVAFLLEDLLDEMECAVVASAARLEEALAAATDQDLDLALLDVNLGGATRSFPVAEQLRARGVPFAFLTAYGEGVLPEAFLDVPLLRKPLRPEDLKHFLTGIRASPPRA